MRYRDLALLLALCLMLTAGISLAEDGQAFAPVAENESFALSVTADGMAMTLLEKATGNVWSSSMNDEHFDMASVNAMWSRRMQSLFTVNYTNLDKGLGVIVATPLADSGHTAALTPLEAGVRIAYDLEKVGIRLALDILLTETGFTVHIPWTSIEEYGEFALVSIDMMPFLAAASGETEGYFFYPDGSGALMAFTDDAHMNEKTRVYDVYNNLLYYEDLLLLLDESDPVVMLPVFGMKRGENGFIAILEDGAETARISVNSANNIIRANYLFANFQYRRGFSDMRVTSRSIMVYDRQMMPTDYTMRVVVLPEGNADYNAMARAYRAYLQANGTLQPRARDTRLALDLFMGIKEDGLLFDTYQTLTTFAEAQDMLSALDGDALAEGLAVTLRGWTKDGYGTEPAFFPAAGALGGDKGLAALLRHAAERGIDVLLEANFLNATAGARGYSRRNDVVYLGSFAILTVEDLFLLSPDQAQAHHEDFMRRASGLEGLAGISFEALGRAVPYNYNARRPVTSAQTLSIWQAMLEAAAGVYPLSATGGGSLYVLPYATIVTDIPMQDKDYQFTTQSIPFYQMVVHGSVDYTGRAGNLSPDLEREMLYWVEYGYTPYFELTARSAEALMYTDYQTLFTARFDAWRDRINTVMARLTEGGYFQVAGAYMLSNETLSPGVKRVLYDNGLAVYVNYNDTPRQADGLEIPALDFLIREVPQG